MAVTEAASAAETDGAKPARPFLDGIERAGLRDRIRAEIERRRPKPVALRTLELLAVAAVEPVEDEPGYRVIDRLGEPRRHPDEAAGGPGRPLTLAELVDEIAARHPDLFLPAPPPEPEPEPAQESALAHGASEMRAATARFVETQSERARALAERSSEQGRALAHSAAAGLAAFRARVEARRTGGGFHGGGLRDRFGDHTQRRWIAGGAGALLAMIVAAGLVVGLREGGEPDETPTRTAEAPQAAKPSDRSADKPSAARPAEPPPETETPTEMPEQPRPAPNAVTGQAQVIDTATLRLNGKLVRLFGVEWVRGGQADELTRYINNRPVTCQPVPGSENQLCQIEGRDLSEVVLFNGGGRASPEATPELVAAEDHARSERLGVWKR
ncbi:nuclease [Methylobacterium dankookense]|uniref:Nuclease n=1 Tax=Methylobacterium dankookense TaxID=560405 RepID=A0A564FTV7_9HYPH|nr:nuclease [Methylobacterium dankookense]GJD55315.1 hypothetical protein IFDJLNFL_1199 [Methylobacterium dankookense]VUF11589.1 hypothetical protein MTDSW087_01272 [Methylobacterium dankookense]